MSIPLSLLRALASIPEDRPIALLLRHAERPPLTMSEGDTTLPITAAGAALARELGALLGSRLRALHASPLTRCVQTAEALRAGASAACPVTVDRLLGDPGVYVADADIAYRTWLELGHERVMACLTGADRAPLAGLADPAAAARRLVEHLLAPERDRGLHVFVTHDSLVSATVAQIAGRALERGDWPLFLEGALFWRRANDVVVVYRDLEPAPPIRDGQ